MWGVSGGCVITASGILIHALVGVWGLWCVCGVCVCMCGGMSVWGWGCMWQCGGCEVGMWGVCLCEGYLMQHVWGYSHLPVYIIFLSIDPHFHISLSPMTPFFNFTLNDPPPPTFLLFSQNFLAKASNFGGKNCKWL